ncbi:HAD family hydrolase [Microcoleus sp. FACHB-1515]|uniref:HAD family hydrolase n=1 Tax=Cyanophyceae TaxID=3028117 RepID=UPI0016824DB4|nr:HAD family hydrolase [Microcoleus sp. FACHB-1515]MBD2092048.1 HAD family hydrolase [Microcoleus sp. FACHB-1515]
MSRTALTDRPSQSTSACTTLTVFCDFDGPIVDVSDRYYTTYQFGLADVQEQFGGRAIASLRNGIAPLSKAQFWQMKQNRVPDVEIAERSGLQGEQISWFMQRVCEIVNQPALLHLDRLQPGVRWALELLHSQGARLVLVTLRERQQAMQFLHSHDLLHLFDRIWGATDDHAAYQNCADHKTQLLSEAIAVHSSDSAWMIGDTEADVLAGQAAKVPTIALTCGIRSRRYLHQFNPNLIHSDLVSAVNSILYSNWRSQNFA